MTDAEDFLDRQGRIINSTGWAIVNLYHAEDPGRTVLYSYTVGLTALGIPEFLVTGLPEQVAQSLLNDLAGRVYDKAERFVHGQRIDDLIVGHHAILVRGRPPDNPAARFTYARYGIHRVRLNQVVWPDPRGRFPWDCGYDAVAHVQPLIETDAWRFV